MDSPPQESGTFNHSQAYPPLPPSPAPSVEPVPSMENRRSAGKVIEDVRRDVRFYLSDLNVQVRDSTCQKNVVAPQLTVRRYR